jgi:uncharacterized protein YyaL (SSP411 family)
MSLPSKPIPNSLINESSPYLLQHAYNPVNWLPFGKKAFNKAKKENKALLISIGYSACHWCHVMEHESFEDEQVAQIMNAHFINVKVDREERSDVDMLYMQAVQLMSGHGGWPLNCFVLPNGQAFYGGTYFRKEQWIKVLLNLSELYKHDLDRVVKYASELNQGINQSELLATGKDFTEELNKEVLRKTVAKWKANLDNENGGPNKAPKFPLPSNYLFLIRYAVLENDQELLTHVKLTLNKMAWGGIYDQLHGGFSRYSTDIIWKLPHFEKMLYDNAQLVSLYCEAFRLTGDVFYKQIAEETLLFVELNWWEEEGYFYSAYDADSDGEEGKFYVWNEEDLKEILKDDYQLFSKYYEINHKGYWENGNYILMKSENQFQLLTESGISKNELELKISHCKDLLKQEAKSRIMPGLDDKCITSWNALMCSAYAQAYLSFGKTSYKEKAIQNAQFILKKLSKNGSLLRSFKNGEAKIDGFLEDYSFTAEALINCYLIDCNEFYLQEAKRLTEFSLTEFRNPKSKLCYYTSVKAEPLAARTSEVADNVTPSSNSQLALNLFYLGQYFGKDEWINYSKGMLGVVLQDMQHYGSAYSNWACLALNFVYPFKQIAIVGKSVDEILIELYQHGLTNTILAVSSKASELPLLKNRYQTNETLIYVCENSTCQLPVNSVVEALQYLA